MKLKIKEAEALATLNRVPFDKKAIMEKMWPDSSPAGRATSYSLLKSGRMNYIRPEWIVILCEELRVTPDFLFDFA